MKKNIKINFAKILIVFFFLYLNMNKIDLLNRYSKISIISLLNLGNTISAKDLDVYTRLGSNVFTFEENGENYSFMVLDFKVNGNRYLLRGNEKLEKLILNNLPEDKIKTIKEEIIAASKLDEDEDLKKEEYKNLIDRVKVVRLYSAQVCNGSIIYRIKDEDGSYYRYYDDFLKKENEFYLEDGFKTPLWVEDSCSSEAIYVINSLEIDKKEIDNELKLCNAVNESEGSRINSNLYSWCGDRNFESFGQLSTDMDFKKLILSNYKSKYRDDKVYEAEKLGYLSETLDHYVNKFEKQLKSFIDNDTEYEVSVKLMTKDVLATHYKEHNEYITVRPNMTYGELLRAVIKKCREIENLSDDSVLICNNDGLCISGTWYEKFNDFVDLSKNNNKIKLDIKDLKFKYYTWKGFDRNDDEDMFWKELNVHCKDEKIEPVEEIQVEKKPVEEIQVEDNQEEKKLGNEKLVGEKPVERKPVEEENKDKKPVEEKQKEKKLEEKKKAQQGKGGCCNIQ